MTFRLSLLTVQLFSTLKLFLETMTITSRHFLIIKIESIAGSMSLFLQGTRDIFYLGEIFIMSELTRSSEDWLLHNYSTGTDHHHQLTR